MSNKLKDVIKLRKATLFDDKSGGSIDEWFEAATKADNALAEELRTKMAIEQQKITEELNKLKNNLKTAEVIAKEKQDLQETKQAAEKKLVNANLAAETKHKPAIDKNLKSIDAIRIQMAAKIDEKAKAAEQNKKPIEAEIQQLQNKILELNKENADLGDTISGEKKTAEEEIKVLEEAINAHDKKENEKQTELAKLIETEEKSIVDLGEKTDTTIKENSNKLVTLKIDLKAAINKEEAAAEALDKESDLDKSKALLAELEVKQKATGDILKKMEDFERKAGIPADILNTLTTASKKLKDASDALHLEQSKLSFYDKTAERLHDQLFSSEADKAADTGKLVVQTVSSIPEIHHPKIQQYIDEAKKDGGSTYSNQKGEAVATVTIKNGKLSLEIPNPSDKNCTKGTDQFLMIAHGDKNIPKSMSITAGKKFASQSALVAAKLFASGMEAKIVNPGDNDAALKWNNIFQKLGEVTPAEMSSCSSKKSVLLMKLGDEKSQSMVIKASSGPELAKMMIDVNRLEPKNKDFLQKEIEAAVKEKKSVDAQCDYLIGLKASLPGGSLPKAEAAARTETAKLQAQVLNKIFAPSALKWLRGSESVSEKQRELAEKLVQSLDSKDYDALLKSNLSKAVKTSLEDARPAAVVAKP